jgi:hypothetical protein
LLHTPVWRSFASSPGRLLSAATARPPARDLRGGKGTVCWAAPLTRHSHQNTRVPARMPASCHAQQCEGFTWQRAAKGQASERHQTRQRLIAPKCLHRLRNPGAEPTEARQLAQVGRWVSPAEDGECGEARQLPQQWKLAFLIPVPPEAIICRHITIQLATKIRPDPTDVREQAVLSGSAAGTCASRLRLHCP